MIAKTYMKNDKVQLFVLFINFVVNMTKHCIWIIILDRVASGFRKQNFMPFPALTTNLKPFSMFYFNFPRLLLWIK